MKTGGDRPRWMPVNAGFDAVGVLAAACWRGLGEFSVDGETRGFAQI